MGVRSGRLDEMRGGWFVGSFVPTLLDTVDVEVAVKRYRAGDREGSHYHKLATEITVVVDGQVQMAGRVWSAGDIVLLEPGFVTGFEALTDALTVVVKHPGAPNDKYLVEAETC
ncbi:MAG: hypothetical protein ACOY3P_09255 [Planctomycetota bacterium]